MATVCGLYVTFAWVAKNLSYWAKENSVEAVLGGSLNFFKELPVPVL